MNVSALSCRKWTANCRWLKHCPGGHRRSGSGRAGHNISYSGSPHHHRHETYSGLCGRPGAVSGVARRVRPYKKMPDVRMGVFR